MPTNHLIGSLKKWWNSSSRETQSRTCLSIQWEATTIATLMTWTSRSISPRNIQLGTFLTNIMRNSSRSAMERNFLYFKLIPAFCCVKLLEKIRLDTSWILMLTQEGSMSQDVKEIKLSSKKEMRWWLGSKILSRSKKKTKTLSGKQALCITLCLVFTMMIMNRSSPTTYHWSRMLATMSTSMDMSTCKITASTLIQMSLRKKVL